MDTALACLRYLHKEGFAVSQYSGALNPVIPSQASFQPPRRVPRLDVAVQKTGHIKLEGDAVIECDKDGKSLGKKPVKLSGAITPNIGPDNGDLTKAGAGAPTRGGFLMASDVPPFRAPRLDKGIQKTDAFLPDGVTHSPEDFKRSKYAMSTEELSRFVPLLLKEGVAGITPAGRLEQSARVGAPRASAPPGPSIADQAKPKGPGFGTGIAGAFKGSIGGTAGVAMK